MAITEYADYDGLGLAELVRNKDVKPAELVEEAIGCAEKLNPKLNCVVFRDYDRARATAQGDLPKGMFSGVPFFLKDIFATAEGMPTRMAAGIDHIAHLTGQTPSDDKFEGLTWGLYEAGKRITASEYLLAKGAMQVAARNAAAFHKDYDVWLTSTLGSPPVRIGTFDLDERDPQKSFAPLIDYVQYTAMQNVTGQPAINLPLHWNAAGLPIGAHFVGRYGDETTLLQLAAQLEHAAPWAQRRPDLKG